jgi:hypothetical protein
VISPSRSRRRTEQCQADQPDERRIQRRQNFCNLTLDDAAAADTIGNTTGDMAPFTGTFRPDSPLAAFQGKDANGYWELQASDYVQNKTGHINRFSVIVSPQSCSSGGTTSAQSMSRPGSSLDIDGNGTYDAMTDGILVLRYLFGVRGAALTDRAHRRGRHADDAGADRRLSRRDARLARRGRQRRSRRADRRRPRHALPDRDTRPDAGRRRAGPECDPQFGQIETFLKNLLP